MVDTAPVSTPETTPSRLLDSAEELFAARGFAATSVRDITSEAGCNIASVNYHFGGKAPLYAAVFRRLLGPLREHRIHRLKQALDQAGDRADLELVLGAFTRAFLEPLVSHSRGRITMQLMAREIMEPHLPAGMLETEMIGPVQQALARGFMQVTPDLAREDALRSVLSVVGQLVHIVCFSARARCGSAPAQSPDMEAMVGHVVRFSAAGIRALAEGEGT